MSKLCNVDKMYGKDLNVTVTNAPSNIVKKYSKQFIKNALLISSNNASENDFEDDGFPSLFAMDYEGNPLQLTYAIGQGNGLYISDQDKLEMNIDTFTIREKNSKLYVDTDSLNKCSQDKLGIVKIEDTIEKEQISNNEYEIPRNNDRQPIIPDSTYISVNNNGTLYLPNDFYKYIWKYVQEEIITAIQPLIPKNYFGYLVYHNSFNNISNIVDGGGNQIYESNTITVPSDGNIFGLGFYYTSGENINSSINIKTDQGIKVLFYSPKMKITTYSNYYNVITYGHQLIISDENNTDYNNVPFQIMFPPNFYRSGNNFVNKEYRVEISINGESEKSEWRTRRLYFNFLQTAGNYIIEYIPSDVSINDIDKGNDITFSFNLRNFPHKYLANDLKNLIQYNVSLIWDKTGETPVELWSSGEAGCNLNLNEGDDDVQFTVTWNTYDKEIIKEKLNPTPSDDGANSSSYKINSLYKSKQYTLRISVINKNTNSEISSWDTDFSVNYNTDMDTAESVATPRSIYFSEVNIGNDDSYIVSEIEESNVQNGTVPLNWVYSSPDTSGMRTLRGRKSGFSYHEEKINRINSLFNRKDDDLMTLIFEFKYRDEDINELTDDIYEQIFNEDSFIIKLELLKYSGSNNIAEIITNDGVLNYIKSNKTPNDNILINIYNDDSTTKNKIIKITFKKLIRPSLFIDIIKNEYLNDQYFNYAYMNIIINNYYMNTQEFTVKIDVDSLVMNTIPYSFINSNNSTETYYIDTTIMRLYEPNLNISDTVLFDGYSLNFTEIPTNGENDIEYYVSGNTRELQFDNILNHNTDALKYKVLFTINRDDNNEQVYKKYIYFQSNELGAELPGFMNNNKQFHYIYLSNINNTYNIYNNPDNYDALKTYDGKTLLIKKTGDNNWNYNDNGDFSGYLSNTTYDINNNLITFVDNSNILWYYTLTNKYKINSKNNPLLNINVNLTTDNISLSSVTIDDKNNHANHNGSSNADQLYQALLNQIGNNCINLSSAYNSGASSYDTSSGSASQQETGNKSFNEEVFDFNVQLQMFITPSIELQEWLYNAYMIYKWYGENKSLNDTNYYNLKNIIINILDDLLKGMINSGYSQTYSLSPDLLILKNNIGNISINDNKIYFDTYQDFSVDYEYVYNISTSGPCASVEYSLKSNGSIDWNGNQNKITAFGTDITLNEYILNNLRISDGIFVNTNININIITIDSKPITDYLYYFDYSELYENSTKVAPPCSWSPELVYYNFSGGGYVDEYGDESSAPILINTNSLKITYSVGVSDIDGVTVDENTGNITIPSGLDYTKDNKKSITIDANIEESTTTLPATATCTIMLWNGMGGSYGENGNIPFGVCINDGNTLTNPDTGGDTSSNPSILNVNDGDVLQLYNPYNLSISGNNCTISSNSISVTTTTVDGKEICDFSLSCTLGISPYYMDNEQLIRYYRYSKSILSLEPTK